MGLQRLLGMPAASLCSLLAAILLVLACHSTGAAGPLPGNTYMNPTPEQPGLFQLLPGKAITIASILVAVVGTDEFMLVQQPRSQTHHVNETSLYNWALGQATSIPSPRYSHFCGGVVIMQNGDILLVGGSGTGGTDQMLNGRGKGLGVLENGKQVISVFKRSTMSWSGSFWMQRMRWYASPMELLDGKLLIIGGTNGTDSQVYAVSEPELWDPSQPKQPSKMLSLPPQWVARADGQWFPFLHRLPTGDAALLFVDVVGAVIDVTSPSLDSLLDLPPFPAEQGGLRVPPDLHTGYPRTGAPLLLALLPERNYLHEMVIFGGNTCGRPCSNTSIGSSLALRIAIRLCDAPVNATGPSWTATAGGAGGGSSGCNGLLRRYCVDGDGWELEDMLGLPRVMPDTVLLPNGMVVIVNGAQAGAAGYYDITFFNRGANSSLPNHQALLYVPWAPRGQRFSRLASSPIPRMYHSAACLTPNGTVLVGGCDTSMEYYTTEEYERRLAAGLLSPSPDGRLEYRLEELIPPHILLGPRPAIEAAPAKIVHCQPFEVRVRLFAEPPATSMGVAGGLRVVLAAPCTATHSTNNGQRVVGLVTLAAQAGPASDGNGTLHTLQVAGPPAALPGLVFPGWYMLFVVSGETYSRAAWVEVRRPATTATATGGPQQQKQQPERRASDKAFAAPQPAPQQQKQQQVKRASDAAFAAPQPPLPPLLAGLLGSTSARPFIGALAAAALPPANAAADVGRSSDSVEGFDAAAYLGYTPQEAAAVMQEALQRDEPMWEVALHHYIQQRKQGKPGPLCSRVPVVVSYRVRGSVCNGAYAHVAAWAVAVALGADVLLPPSQIKGAAPAAAGASGGAGAAAAAGAGAKPGGELVNMAFGDLYHANETVRMLQELGIRAVVLPGMGPSDTKLYKAANQYAKQLAAAAPMPGGGGSRSLLSVMFDLAEVAAVRALALSEVVQQATQAVVQAVAKQQGATSRCDALPLVHLHLGNPLFHLRTVDVPLAAHLARGLRLAPLVEAHADRVAAALQGSEGAPAYNGLMLRIELDKEQAEVRQAAAAGNGTAAAAAAAAAARPVTVLSTLRDYAASCKAAGFDLDTPVYVSSGQVSYAATQALWPEVLKLLKPFSSKVLHLGMLLGNGSSSGGSGGNGNSSGSSGGLSGLSSEQAAAVDVLVLERGKRFVGAAWSTASLFVAQRRALSGLPPAGASLLRQPKYSVDPFADVHRFAPACDVLECVGGSLPGAGGSGSGQQPEP